jgi:predicted O-methyltransferase YrrM
MGIGFMHSPSATRVSSPSAILDQIFTNGIVNDGRESVHIHSHIARADGEFIQQIVDSTDVTTSLEIGMAFGVSTLFICEALRRREKASRHVVIDPFQRTDWRGIGLRNVAAAGCLEMVDFIEERSEFALPKLLAEERTFDFVFVDGLHTFDQALVEFYYLNRMLKVGGAMIFDDANWPSIRAATRYIATYPAYRVLPRYPLRPTRLGRIRARFTALPTIRRLVHPAIRVTSWQMGLGSRCAAFRKVAEDVRDEKWFEEF